MKKFWIFLFGILGALGFLLVVSLVWLGDGKLHVYFLDIGQGDGILVRTPMSQYVLIDGGPDSKVLQEMSEVMPFYERTIDVMILSHPHADHINGLIEVLKRYEVKEILMSGSADGAKAYAEFLRLAVEGNVSIRMAKAAKDFRLGNVVLDFVYPVESFEGRHFENANNSSNAFRLMFGETVFFFSGDLELEGEEELAGSGQDLRADVFKAGHHGSRTSSSEPILDLVQPEYAVISCGLDNKFKHPHPETIEHFQERGVKVFRTDLHSTIEFVSDGLRFWNTNSETI